MNDDEVRFTSETGGEKGQKSARLGGADPLALMELARVYGYGEAKYARYNYLKGYPWSLSVDALFRHLLAYLAGEDRDPESGLLHTAHVAWHGLALTSFLLRGIGEDNRVEPERPQMVVVPPPYDPLKDPDKKAIFEQLAYMKAQLMSLQADD